MSYIRPPVAQIERLLTCTRHVMGKAFSNLLACINNFFPIFLSSFFFFCWFASYTFIGPNSNNKVCKELIKNNNKIYTCTKIRLTAHSAQLSIYFGGILEEKKSQDHWLYFPEDQLKSSSGPIANQLLLLLMAIFSGFCGETWLDHWTLSNIARHHPWGKV